MANLLADPELWEDATGGPPPPSWNGVAYAVSVGAETFELYYLTGTLEAGNTVAGTITFDDADDTPSFLNFIDAESSSVVGSVAIGGGTPVPFSFDVSASGTHNIIFAASEDSQSGQLFYGLEATIVPAGQPPDPGPGDVSYNCSCDPGTGQRNVDTLGNMRSRLIHRLGFVDPLGASEIRTLADFRRELMIRAGYAANASNPPPGELDLIDAIVNESQQLLWRRLELDQSGAQPDRMTDPTDANTLDYPLIFAMSLGQLKAHKNKQDAKLYLDQAEKQLADYMRRSPPSIVALATDFLQEAQRFLYDKVASFRQSRFFYWPLEPGVRFYDFAQNEGECELRFVPELVEGVFVSDGDDPTTERWRELSAGIHPALYSGGVRESSPYRYEFRQCIELFPAPDDRVGFLRIKAKFELQRFEEDTDSTTIDADLVFMQALAVGKAHFNQPDAREYAGMVQSKIGDIIAGSHHTRRYIPVDGDCPPANPPRAADGYIEN